MGWVEEAFRKGELKVTEDFECPIHNPEHRSDAETNLSACEEHKWINKWFFGGRFPELANAMKP